jgi:hypothetical protein
VRFGAPAIELALGALDAICDGPEERQTFGRRVGGWAGGNGKRHEPSLMMHILRLTNVDNLRVSSTTLVSDRLNTQLMIKRLTGQAFLQNASPKIGLDF